MVVTLVPAVLVLEEYLPLMDLPACAVDVSAATVTTTTTDPLACAVDVSVPIPQAVLVPPAVASNKQTNTTQQIVRYSPQRKKKTLNPTPPATPD